MLKKKNGFTLVELLAVIVILAVLLLLAVPAAIRLMDKARRSAFGTEANAIIDAAKTAYTYDSVQGNISFTEHCYSLDQLEEYLDKDLTDYSGSVSISVTDSKHKIWLSNNQFIVEGKMSSQLTDNANISDNTDDEKASTTCGQTNSTG